MKNRMNKDGPEFDSDSDSRLSHGLGTPIFSLGGSPPPLAVDNSVQVPQIITDDMVAAGLVEKPTEEVDHRSNLLYNANTLNQNVKNHMQVLIERFHRRASRVRDSIEHPISSGSSDISGEWSGDVSPILSEPGSGRGSAVPHVQEPHPPPPAAASDAEVVPVLHGRRLHFKQIWTKLVLTPISPQSVASLLWLCTVSVVFIYNCFTIPMRAAFPFQTPGNSATWRWFDYLGDFINVLDILLYRSRLKFYRDGFWVTDVRDIYKTYLSSRAFKLDLAAVIPLNLLSNVFEVSMILRINRLLKISAYWKLMERLDSVLASPHYVRVARMIFYMVLLIHLNACAYYSVSRYEGIAVNAWTYDGVGNPYIRCLYFATKLAISIGKNPKPVTLFEHVFMTFSWLFGVFIFAVFLGQIRDIVGQMSEKDEMFRSIMDNTNEFMHQLDLPAALRDRIKLWLRYTWQQQKSLNELKALEILPQKIQTDIALDIHGATLRKVQMFQDCDEGLLRDLVLKLKPINYLPGDFVCKKGEVGREMYIIQAGQVIVMGGDTGHVVLATLQQGSVFGEISLLGLEGLDRRTADVRSRGFSTLFVLDKNDLQEAISSYPEAQNSMQERARELLKKNADMTKAKRRSEEDIIIDHGQRLRSPKLLQTLYQVAEPQWKTVQTLRSRGHLSQSSMDMRSVNAVEGASCLLSPLSLPPRWPITSGPAGVNNFQPRKSKNEASSISVVPNSVGTSSRSLQLMSSSSDSLSSWRQTMSFGNSLLNETSSSSDSVPRTGSHPGPRAAENRRRDDHIGGEGINTRGSADGSDQDENG